MHQPVNEHHTTLPTRSEAARWHALLTEAEAAMSCCLDQDEASYLVELLRRRQTSFRRGLARSEPTDSDLRDVGDLMLLWAGLLPEQVLAAGVSIGAVVERGRQAYQALADGADGALYARLSRDFVAMMDLLQTMREIDRGGSPLKPLQAWDLWAGTRSRYAQRALGQFSPRSLPAPAAAQGVH